jgi:hypothetical protein
MLLGELIESKRKVAATRRVDSKGNIIYNYETFETSEDRFTKYDNYSIFNFEHNGMMIMLTYCATSTDLRIIRKEPFALLAEGKLEDYCDLQIGQHIKSAKRA